LADSCLKSVISLSKYKFRLPFYILSFPFPLSSLFKLPPVTMNPHYDHNLPGIYQSTGYYTSPTSQSNQPSYQICSWPGPQVHVAGFAPDINITYSWDFSVDPRFPGSSTPNGTIPRDDSHSYSTTTGESHSPVIATSLQRANASRGNLARSALIDCARAAKVRSQSRHIQGS